MKSLNFDHKNQRQTLAYRSYDNRESQRKRFGKSETTIGIDPKPISGDGYYIKKRKKSK